jgi:hypothetical protein
MPQKNEFNPFKPPIKPVPMPVFPTLGSLQEVVDLAHSLVPIQNRNEVTSLLMTYHNTLLNELKP